jgi:hypothetical protein
MRYKVKLATSRGKTDRTLMAWIRRKERKANKRMAIKELLKGR